MVLLPNFVFDEINSHYHMWYGKEYIGSFSNACYTQQYFREEKWWIHVLDKSYFIVEYKGKRWFFDQTERTEPKIMSNEWFNWFLYYREFWFVVAALFTIITWVLMLLPFSLKEYWCCVKEFVVFSFSCKFPDHLKHE